MDFIGLLNYFGLTADKVTPLLVVTAIVSFTYWKLIVKPDRAEFSMAKTALTDLHNATKEVQMYLERDDAFTPQHSLERKTIFDMYGKHASPMQPNDKGSQLLQESGFNDAYPQLKEKIFEQMDKMNLRTPYDYEAGASRALILLSTDPGMDVIKISP